MDGMLQSSLWIRCAIALLYQDLDVTELDDFRYNHVNLTGFRLVNYHDPKAKDILRRMRADEKRTGSKLFNSTSVIKVWVHNSAHSMTVVAFSR